MTAEEASHRAALGEPASALRGATTRPSGRLGRVKHYFRDALRPVFERYLPGFPGGTSATPRQAKPASRMRIHEAPVKHGIVAVSRIETRHDHGARRNRRPNCRVNPPPRRRAAMPTGGPRMESGDGRRARRETETDCCARLRPRSPRLGGRGSIQSTRAHVPPPGAARVRPVRRLPWGDRAGAGRLYAGATLNRPRPGPHRAARGGRGVAEL